MPAAWITAGSAVLGALGSGDSGGGQQTVSKDPWAPAAPWLTSLIGQGQNMQGQYQAHPFNNLQQVGYGNLLQGNDYINQMTPGLLAQFSQPTGYDRNNPRAKPQAYQFPAMLPMKNTYNFLGSSLDAANAPQGMAAPAAPAGPAPLSPLDWARSLGGAGGSY